MTRLPSLLLLAVLAVLVGVRPGIQLYSDWLWFHEIGFTQVFRTVLEKEILLGLVFGALFFLLIYVNLKLASRNQGQALLDIDSPVELPPIEMIEPLFRRFLLPGSLVLAVIAGAQAAGKWESLVRFINAVPFGTPDPVFQRDVGFYIFQLPALSWVAHWLFTVLGLTLVATAVTYVLYRFVEIAPRGIHLPPGARAHLLVLLGALLVAKAWGYSLEKYDLLFSSGGAAFGAGYTDLYARLPALQALTVIALIAGILCFLQIARQGYRWVFLGVGTLVVVHVAGLALYPGLLQYFRVAPNQVDAERPYIRRNIELTRKAYGLDKIETKEFPAEPELSPGDLRNNDATIKNIRLWDDRAALATFGQLQEIRTYYKFVDVDNDRYKVDGAYRQMMISGRELSHEHLPSRIWINEHLNYTHGYGAVFGPVNRVTPEGLPEFLIKDIPPVSSGDIKITRPEIYYGELANDYVFVKTRAQELDYPSGSQNIYTTYQGSGGIPADSFLRKLIFSARFGSWKIALSNDITQGSRILYHRQVRERVQKAAPFVVLDRDTYLVIAEGGRLFWIIDGYTVSSRFPYSTPTPGVGNYIRNSVKAVVDAYNGTVTLYLSDPQDPLILAYQRAFPGLLKPMSSMPPDLAAHVRYPQDLFMIQARVFAVYHMQDPQVFYNKEDLLSIPVRSMDGGEQEMAPYYTIMKLPGEKEEEYVLLLPFTPNKRDNMRAWLAARSDPPNYGKLIAYDFPKARLVYGPKQVDARIDQDAFISQQLSLWGQRGSQVLRGNLLAIPIEKSLLYVQPLYLAAEKGALPELKRVIVASGNRIAMEETLEASLNRIFGGKGGQVEARSDGKAPEISKSASDSLALALRHLERSRQLLSQGDWAGYGEELKRLEEVLRKSATR